MTTNQERQEKAARDRQLKQLMACCTTVGGFVFKYAQKNMRETKKKPGEQQHHANQSQHLQQQTQHQQVVQMSGAPQAQEPMPTRPNANFMQAPASSNAPGAQVQPQQYHQQQPQTGQPQPHQPAWQGPAVVAEPIIQQALWQGPSAVAQPINQKPAWGGESPNPLVMHAPAAQQPAWGSPNATVIAAPSTQQQQQPAWGGGAVNPAVMAASAPSPHQPSAWGSSPNAAVMTATASVAAAAAPAVQIISNAGSTANINVDLATAMSTLWSLDSNRLMPGRDYQLDIQGYTKFHSEQDRAHEPLFAHVDNAVLSRPTYATFVALLDNYEAETGKAERTTSYEKREQESFLDAIMQTAPMQFCHRYLAKTGNAPNSTEAFKDKLETMWFRLYKSTSGKPADSSGFEHVFVGKFVLWVLSVPARCPLYVCLYACIWICVHSNL
jgi:hypothetical protein